MNAFDPVAERRLILVQPSLFELIATNVAGVRQHRECRSHIEIHINWRQALAAIPRPKRAGLARELGRCHIHPDNVCAIAPLGRGCKRFTCRLEIMAAGIVLHRQRLRRPEIAEVLEHAGQWQKGKMSPEPTPILDNGEMPFNTLSRQVSCLQTCRCGHGRR